VPSNSATTSYSSTLGSSVQSLEKRRMMSLKDLSAFWEHPRRS
jgi:hypothetical protein